MWRTAFHCTLLFYNEIYGHTISRVYKVCLLWNSSLSAAVKKTEGQMEQLYPSRSQRNLDLHESNLNPSPNVQISWTQVHWPPHRSANFSKLSMKHFDQIKGHTKCPFLKPMWMNHTSRIRKKCWCKRNDHFMNSSVLTSLKDLLSFVTFHEVLRPSQSDCFLRTQVDDLHFLLRKLEKKGLMREFTHSFHGLPSTPPSSNCVGSALWLGS